jgi:hypothetical protein
MGFSNGAYAKIKDVEDKGNYTKAKIVISKKIKNRNPAQYVCTFAGWVSFVGKAHQCRPMSGQKIKITNCDVTNGYMTSDGRQEFAKSAQCTVFEYELQQDGASAPAVQPNWEELAVDDALPF